MAQSVQSFGQYVCRSCLRTLRSAGQSQLRTFSNSAQRSKVLPDFQPTSSPELDATLGDWRAKVFIPNVLAQRHRDLIYKSSRHEILLKDPGVTVTLPNGEDIKLQPMQRWDKPNLKKTLDQLVQILGSTSDADTWNILIPFLEAMKSARYEIKPKYLGQITNAANRQGRQGIIIQCAMAGRRTGLRLCIEPVTKELLIGCHERAAEVGFEGKTAQKQAHLASTIARMLEEPLHHSDLQKTPYEVDMRREPIVCAILLEFAAQEAIHEKYGVDTAGTVASLSRTLLALSEERESRGRRLVQESEQETRDAILEEAAILYNAVQMALKVDMKASVGKSEVAKVQFALKKMSDNLERRIEPLEKTAKEAAAAKPTRALTMLEKMRSVQEKLDQMAADRR